MSAPARFRPSPTPRARTTEAVVPPRVVAGGVQWTDQDAEDAPIGFELAVARGVAQPRPEETR